MPDVADDSAPKDSRFNPSRIPLSDAAQAIVADVRGQLLNYERYLHTRRRARRAADQERFDLMVRAIVCDLMHATLVDPQGWRHVSLSKRHSATDGVGAWFMTADRIKIIQWMASPEMRWLELEKGRHVPYFGGEQTRIRADWRLKVRMDEQGIGFEDIGHDPTLMGDPIVLKSEKVRKRAKSLPVPLGEPAESYRAEMLRINEALTQADIFCFPDSGRERDVGNRWMRRVFNNGRLDHGGRLYGGFWQGMSAELRVENIELSGEQVVSLDFGQCGVRIAYGIAGAQPPEGDLYCVPGLERFRDGVKMVLNSMLSSSEKLTRKPGGSAKHFTRHWSFRDIEERIFKHHHPIRDLCYTGLAWTLQYIESRIVIQAMLELLDKGISILPIHDCLLAPASTVTTVRETLMKSFKDITGVEGQITI